MLCAARLLGFRDPPLTQNQTTARFTCVGIPFDRQIGCRNANRPPTRKCTAPTVVGRNTALLTFNLHAEWFRNLAKKKRKKDPEKASFADLSLSEVMLAALARADYQYPTPIQAGMIPVAFDGIDIVGQAQTGTGKTAAFSIPIIEMIEPGGGGPQALILVPTRELAVQVREEIVRLAHGQRISCIPIYGGKPIRGQIEKLRRGCDIVVGTPGRILDHMARGTLKFDDVEFVVLDEADRMLDIGFRPDIEKILRRCPKDRQTLLLSATMPPPIQRLAQRYMFEPETLDFSPKDIAVETIDQYYFTVDHLRKFDLLSRLLAREEPKQALIFCRTKRRTEQIGKRLKKKHRKHVDCIHGDMAQSARDRVMSRFREGNLRYLVATDVVGRGIDVSGISHIINYDIPQFCDDYVHRVGRTGRMGREGIAYTLVSPEEGIELTRIEQRINRQLKRGEMTDFDTAAPREEESQTEEKSAPPPPPAFGRRRARHRKGL
jgi:ATP-dependent RNA helicase DeaD